MIPLLKRLWYRLRYDELAVRRWGRAALMGLGGSGLAFADQLAAIVGDGSPGVVKLVKFVAVVSALLSVMVTAGDKNPKGQP